MLVANAVAHIISFQKLKKAKTPNPMGVFAFVFIIAMIAFLIWQGISLSKWLALTFPAIGGLGLLVTTILKRKGTWIDYVIFVLDIVIVS